MKFDDNFPGADLVAKGIENLHDGKFTVEALLVLIGGPRLRRLGIPVPQHHLQICPELSLYQLLQKNDNANAYSLYNSYLRRLISFEHACEQVYYKQCRIYNE